MLTETQRVVFQWFLIFVITMALVRIVWIFELYSSEQRKYNKYADNHFKKIEEYRNVFN